MSTESAPRGRPKRERVVLITGASSGLGAALARAHAARGHALVLVARRAEALGAVARDCAALGARKVRLVRGDVGDPRTAVRAAGAAREMGGLDTAYANAGYSVSGRLETLDPAAWKAQMRVNVEGVLHTVQACGPLLAESGGALGIVGSVAGYGSTAGSGAYAASKAALRSLAATLSVEWAHQGIAVTHIAPGFFASEIRRRNRAGGFDPGVQEYIPTWLLGDVQGMARGAMRAVEARRREWIWPLHAKVLVFFLRHFPGLSHSLNHSISKLRFELKIKAQVK